jgi:hypothetical protein
MLSPQQQRLVAALLSTPSITMACKRARVATRTYRDWWNNKPEFRDAVRQAGRDAVARAGVALQALCSRAAVTLAKALRGQAKPVQVKAAIAVLDRAAQATAVQELTARVEALERSQPCSPAFITSRNVSSN